MTGFSEILASGEWHAGGLFVEVPKSWHQGRTAYGGFSSAMALAVAQRVGGESLPPLRSAQLAMMAPVNGRVEVTARIERQGRNATWISAAIHGGNGLAFSASFVFMGAIESGLHLNQRSAPDEHIPVREAAAVSYTRHTPAFLASHFEARHGLAVSDGKRPDISRWVRLSERKGLDPMVELLLLADALPPGVMPLLTAVVPVSTMHWQVNLLTPAPVTEDGWWLLRSIGDYAEKGCSSQRMGLWNAQGAPILAGMQSIALFG